MYSPQINQQIFSCSRQRGLSSQLIAKRQSLPSTDYGSAWKFSLSVSLAFYMADSPSQNLPCANEAKPQMTKTTRIELRRSILMIISKKRRCEIHPEQNLNDQFPTIPSSSRCFPLRWRMEGHGSRDIYACPSGYEKIKFTIPDYFTEYETAEFFYMCFNSIIMQYQINYLLFKIPNRSELSDVTIGKGNPWILGY